ncbi:hypothetical protein IG193_01060 [Infirmifilum lucidum]|uniref:Uncharacterized protein n=1 Tax=Infirmifilum lucidum TaxID=2776706 RepID=A0A7L9FJM4_9CREN|nr:hypothetical protein [Infirmifilum lucidum]QOJ79086.1 hypothetical protein IG193_01060 [Infirmifilum lucidum]
MPGSGAEKRATAGLPLIGEEVYLRALTGYLVGSELLCGAGRVALVPLNDRICLSPSAAIAAAYWSKSGLKEGVVAVFEYNQSNPSETADRVLKWGPDTIAILFGGESRLGDVNRYAIDFLRALRDRGFKGRLVIHVRTWLATKGLENVLADPELARYLESLPEIRVFTANLDAKKFYYSRVAVSAGKASLQTLAESNLNNEHVSLLRNSLPPP